LQIHAIEILHGKLPILGFKFGNSAYLTDVKTIPTSELSKLTGLKHLVINALHHHPHPTHLNVQECLELIKEINPENAWITGQIRWTVDMRGWGAVLNYPDSCQESSRMLRELHGEEMREMFEYNVAVLIHLLREVKSGSVSPWPVTLTEEFRAQGTNDVELMTLAASISWSTLGIAVWSGGQHVPSESVAEIDQYGSGMVNAHIERLVDSAR
jgi:hypothetical protein